MNLYTTEILAKVNGKLTLFAGPNVPGISFSDAEEYCQNNGLGYCKVTGLLESEIPCVDGTCAPNWAKQKDYRNLN